MIRKTMTGGMNQGSHRKNDSTLLRPNSTTEINGLKKNLNDQLLLRFLRTHDCTPVIGSAIPIFHDSGNPRVPKVWAVTRTIATSAAIRARGLLGNSLDESDCCASAVFIVVRPAK
jgi:hypothetical protein